MPLRVATGYNDLKIDQALVKPIGGVLEASQSDVAILDPLVTLHSAPEAASFKKGNDRARPQGSGMFENIGP